MIPEVSKDNVQNELIRSVCRDIDYCAYQPITVLTKQDYPLYSYIGKDDSAGYRGTNQVSLHHLELKIPGINRLLQEQDWKQASDTIEFNRHA